jgi:hypothetical protein
MLAERPQPSLTELNKNAPERFRISCFKRL